MYREYFQQLFSVVIMYREYFQQLFSVVIMYREYFQQFYLCKIVLKSKKSSDIAELSVNHHAMNKVAVAVSVEAPSLYRHRSQRRGRLWVRLPLPTGQFFEI